MTAATAAGSLEDDRVIMDAFEKVYGTIIFQSQLSLLDAFEAGWNACNLKIVEMKDGE